MKFKHLTKRTALVAIVVLLLPLFTAGSMAAPLQQDVSPEAIACGDSIVCNRTSAAVSVTNNGTGAAYYAEGFRTAIRAKGVPGVFASSWGGVGLKGKSTNSHGVVGQSDYGWGVWGTSYDLEGVRGVSNGAGAADNGVFGETNSTYQFEAGVYGYSTAAAAGVIGRSVSGWGGYLQADVNSQPDLVLGGTSSTNEDGTIWSHPSYAGSDILLYSNDEVHVHLDENNDEAGNFVVYSGDNYQKFRVDETSGWYGDWTDAESDTVIRARDNIWLHTNDDLSGSLGAVDILDGSDNICIILSDDGNIYKYCGGTSSAVIETSDNVPRRLYVMESPEVWLEDFGFGKLEKGAATVNIEPLFLSTINTGVPYHVFVTPLGDCGGLYVTNKTATSFDVRELGGGTADVEFEFRVIAKRLGWEDARMEPAPVDSQGSPVPGTELDELPAAEPIILEVNEGGE